MTNLIVGGRAVVRDAQVADPAFLLPLFQGPGVDRYVEDPGSDQLGLEKFLSYTGEETGGGSQLLTNLYSGNAVWSYDAFSNPGRGLSTFGRFAYNSQDTSDTVLGFGDMRVLYDQYAHATSVTWLRR